LRNDTADGYGIKLACYGKCVLLLSSAFNVEARYGSVSLSLYV